MTARPTPTAPFHDAQAPASAVLRGVLIGTLALACLAFSTAAAAAASESMPVSQLQAGWEADAAPLFLGGPGRAPATNDWLMPGSLSRGRYVLVGTEDGQRVVVHGSDFDVDTSGPYRIHMFVRTGVTDVVAVPVRYLPDPRQAARATVPRTQ